ncbi:GIY-YIG nuclease family protein [Bacillus sp. NPDC094077]|uniref:GIY-YIG nuclease family protein n=1 Tax=Bacillus sp. NPDC094077 TaxID=3390932 RepID=UPI003D036278
MIPTNNQKEFERNLDELFQKIDDEINGAIEYSKRELKEFSRENNMHFDYARIRDNVFRENMNINNYLYKRCQQSSVAILKKQKRNEFLKEKLEILKRKIDTAINNLDEDVTEYREDVLRRSAERLLCSVSLLSNVDLRHIILEPLEKPYGYIYIIKEFHSNTYKIGYSRDVNIRKQQFEVKLPFEWEFLAVFEVENAREKESLLHRQFKLRRLNGEWFELTSKDLINLSCMMGNINTEEVNDEFNRIKSILEEEELKFSQKLIATRGSQMLFDYDFETIKDNVAKRL